MSCKRELFVKDNPNKKRYRIFRQTKNWY